MILKAADHPRKTTVNRRKTTLNSRISGSCYKSFRLNGDDFRRNYRRGRHLELAPYGVEFKPSPANELRLKTTVGRTAECIKRLATKELTLSNQLFDGRSSQTRSNNRPATASALVTRSGQLECRLFRECDRSGSMSEPYKIVVGLEVHVQLLTKTKLFCGCRNQFGLPPNSATCPVCLGCPASLPVMNRRPSTSRCERRWRSTATSQHPARAGFTKWDRKNYYYPDLPKNYQISQYDLPFSHDGWLEINVAPGPEEGVHRPRRSASSAPTSKRTPARTCTTRPAAAATPWSTSTAPARRCWRSSASRT